MIGLVDYEAGNIRSVSNALQKIGAAFLVSNDAAALSKCSGIILPGVGAAPGAMRSLEQSNLIEFLQTTTKPFLGICLGMELLFKTTEEGNIDCLGVLTGAIKRFDSGAEKIPHMGWNVVEPTRENALFTGIGSPQHFYFAHSYYAPVTDAASAVTSCGITFAASVASGNFYGVQFHPEKSGAPGLQVLTNFWALCR